MKTIQHSEFAARCLLGLSVLCAGAGGSIAADVDVYEAPPASVPAAFAAAAIRQRAPESLALPGAFQPGRNVHDLGAVPAGRIEAADQAAAGRFAGINPAPQRVGFARTPAQGRLSFKAGHGLRQARQGRGDLWTMAVRSPGGLGMRLSFTNVDLGTGSMIVYARDGEEVVTLGPFTGKGPNGTGQFWTGSLPGDTAFIEVTDGADPSVEIAEIVHFDRPFSNVGAQAGTFTAASQPCQLDVMCFGPPSVQPLARDAVGQMNFMSGGSGFVCTGTILNDLDADTIVPYFLTAHHCIGTQAEADTLEVVFGWQRSACGGSLPSKSSLPRSVGATLLASTSTDAFGNDMSFLRLNGSLPAGATLAGWTTASLPSTVVGIHHPGGTSKKVTFSHESGPGGLAAFCVFAFPTFAYHYLQEDTGITEGGSSGSGIFNASGQLMGQLYGACCDPALGTDCSGANCDNRTQWRSVYGKFDFTFPRIQRWLEIGGTIHVDRNFGGAELGTPAQPFNTVTEGNDFAWDGVRIKIRPGSYPEALTISKRVTLLASGGPVTIGR